MEDAIELPTASSRSHLNEVVKSILATDDFDLKTLMGSSIGDNYIGVVYRVLATTNDAKKDDLSVIVKLPPQNTARREQFFAGPSFMKEIWVYDEVIQDKRKNCRAQLNASKQFFLTLASAIVSTISRNEGHPADERRILRSSKMLPNG